MALSTEQYPHLNAKSPCASVSITRVVFQWIDKRYHDTRNASKKLASLASFADHQVSARTTEAWLARRSPPSLQSIEIMAARCDELAEQLERERGRLRELLSK